MIHIISKKILCELSQFIALHMGLNFSDKRFLELEYAITQASKEFKFIEVNKCINWLLHTPFNNRKNEILALYLTIGETYFFREPSSFQALEKIILPELIKKRSLDKYLRIWSAGCSTGEEAYSIAIVLSKLLPDIENWKITLLATDINVHSLKIMATGIYKKWSFRFIPPEIKSKYFVKIDEYRYQISSKIKKLVNIQYHNLYKDSYPANLNLDQMDVIFCRNTLMYFEPQSVLKIVESLCVRLVDNGWLNIGTNETTLIKSKFLKVCNFPGCYFFQKKTVEKLPIQKPDLVIFNPIHKSRKKKKIVVAPPPSERIILLFARTLANKGALGAALKKVENSLQNNQLQPSLYYLKAIILQELGDLSAAVAALRKSLYLNPEYSLAYLMLGYIFHKQRKWERAKKMFLKLHTILQNMNEDYILPDSEGMTVKMLIDITESILCESHYG